MNLPQTTCCITLPTQITACELWELSSSQQLPGKYRREPQQSITGATAGIAIYATLHACVGTQGWGRLTCCSDILGTAAKEASACFSNRSFRGEHSLALQAHSNEREACIYLNCQALTSLHPISPSLCRHCCDSSSSSLLLNISAETWEFLFMWKASNTSRISVSHNPKHFVLLQWTGWLSSWWAKKGRRVISSHKSSGLHTHTHTHICIYINI